MVSAWSSYIVSCLFAWLISCLYRAYIEYECRFIQLIIFGFVLAKNKNLLLLFDVDEKRELKDFPVKLMTHVYYTSILNYAWTTATVPFYYNQ